MKINLVKIISTEVDDAMRRIVKVLRMGLKDIRTPFEASPFGVDSNCPKNFIAVYAETEEKGKNVIIGYLNKNAKADVGELRLFSTDKDGKEKFYVQLKNNGFLGLGGTGNFAVKFNELKTEFNSLKGTVSSHITTYNTHTHPVAGTVANATLNVSVGPTANIDNAKNDKIKTL